MKWTTPSEWLVLALPALAMLVAQLPVATASPVAIRPNILPDGIDFDALQNKVRSGAIAIANADRPRDEHGKHANCRNGDVVDTSIIDTPDHLPESSLHARRHEEGCGHCDPSAVVRVPGDVTGPHCDHSTCLTPADDVRFYSCY